MEYTIETVTWRRSQDAAPTDVTDALDRAVLSPTPHPDPDVDRPKGYTIKLTLKPDSTAFASELEAAMLDLDPPTVSLTLDGRDEPLESLEVNVSKVPYPGDQNVAELGVTPDHHDRVHAHL